MRSLQFTYVTNVLSPPATIAMADVVDNALSLVIRKLSDENYAQSLASYRLWYDIGQTHYQITPDYTFHYIWNNRVALGSMTSGHLIYSIAHLILRFARDVESGHVLDPPSSGLQSRLCARSLQEFFNNNIETVRSGSNGSVRVNFHADVNLIAHWANLGYIEEEVIRNHILQSLIFPPELWVHQADALIILFKIAGATFTTYADPSVVDRCFQRLNDHYLRWAVCYNSIPVRKGLMQVRTPRPVKGGHRAEANF